MQTIQVALAIAVGSVVIWLIASRTSDRNGGWAPKVLVGISVGLLAGLVVSALTGDVLPDELEAPVLTGLAIAISVVIVGAFAMRRWVER